MFPGNFGFGCGLKPKLPPLGRRLEGLVGVRGVTRQVYVVPSELSYVVYP